MQKIPQIDSWNEQSEAILLTNYVSTELQLKRLLSNWISSAVLKDKNQENVYVIKGQLISKCLFGVSNSPKKWTWELKLP